MSGSCEIKGVCYNEFTAKKAGSAKSASSKVKSVKFSKVFSL